MKRLIILSIEILLISQLQGCAVTAIGAGIAAVKYANAKKIEAKQSCYKNYNDYLKISKHPIKLSDYCTDSVIK